MQASISVSILLATVLVVLLLEVAARSICSPLMVMLLTTPPAETVKVEILGVPAKVVGAGDIVALPVTTGATMAAPAVVGAERIWTPLTVMPVIAPAPVTVMVEVTGLIGAANAAAVVVPPVTTGVELVVPGAVTVTTPAELVAL